MQNISMYEKHSSTPLADLMLVLTPHILQLLWPGSRNSSKKFIFTILAMNIITYSLCLGWEHLLTGGGTAVVDRENFVALAFNASHIWTVRELRVEAGVILTVGEVGHRGSKE
jgi:hypothetical protein